MNQWGHSPNKEETGCNWGQNKFDKAEFTRRFSDQNFQNEVAKETSGILTDLNKEVREQIQTIGRLGSTKIHSDSTARNARITDSEIRKPKFFNFVIAIVACLLQNGVYPNVNALRNERRVWYWAPESPRTNLLLHPLRGRQSSNMREAPSQIWKLPLRHKSSLKDKPAQAAHKQTRSTKIRSHIQRIMC